MLTFSSSYFCSHFPYIIYFCILKRSRKLKRSFVSLLLAFVACLKWKIFNFLAATKEFAANLGDYEGGGGELQGKAKVEGDVASVCLFPFVTVPTFSVCILADFREEHPFTSRHTNAHLRQTRNPAEGGQRLALYSFTAGAFNLNFIVVQSFALVLRANMPGPGPGPGPFCREWAPTHSAAANCLSLRHFLVAL